MQLHADFRASGLVSAVRKGAWECDLLQTSVTAAARLERSWVTRILTAVAAESVRAFRDLR